MTVRALPARSITLAERLAAIVRAMPESGAVTLPVAELRRWLADDNGNNGKSVTVVTPAEREPDRLLSADDVAERLHCSRRYVYTHVPDFPFAKKLPGGAVRFSERGLVRWMEQSR